jgi:peptide/nickel transport system substrate-binding protein
VLPEKDAEGYRLGPDGKRFVPILTVISDLSYGTHYVQVAEMLIAHWKEVGIEVQLDAVTDAVFDEARRTVNQYDMFLFHGGEGGAGLTAILDPRWHVPGEYFGMFSFAWYLWRTDTAGTNEYAIEPPAYAQEVRDMYIEAIQQPSIDGQIAKMQEIMQRSADIFWTIGVSRPGSDYWPVHERLGNIPDTWWQGWLPGNAKIIFPEQWYLKE